MPNFSRNEVVLVRYPFVEGATSKIRPAVVVGSTPDSDDYLIVPLTSRTVSLRHGEFALADWEAAGLNLPSAVKRGLYTVHGSLVLKSVGRLSPRDVRRVDESLRSWLHLG